MWSWMAGRPCRCLRIGASKLAWVEVRRGWNGRPRHRCAVTSLVPGVIRVSPVNANIADMPALEAILRSLVWPARHLRVDGRSWIRQIPLPITLILPDLCVRTVVLQLDQLPARTEERDALIRWRIGQEQLVPLADAKVVSQVWSPGRPAKGPHTVLAVVIQDAVLAQYELACESVGLIPVDVDIASFRLFNLWAATAGWTGTSAGDLMWLNVADGGLTLFLFHDGRLVFVRTKLLGSAVPSEDGLHTGPDDRNRRVIDECLASIQACRERHPRLTVQRLAFAADDPDPELPEVLAQELDVPVHPLNWSQIQRAGWKPVGKVVDAVALPAIAGVL
ncbi:MAG TPA: hypothetical protein VNK46_12205 [Nitrospiraceae bacterium]|jgi:hypothetical protein|nr:hypothetical protein [Nitrospiraceae bacterium]